MNRSNFTYCFVSIAIAPPVPNSLTFVSKLVNIKFTSFCQDSFRFSRIILYFIEGLLSTKMIDAKGSNSSDRLDRGLYQVRLMTYKKTEVAKKLKSLPNLLGAINAYYNYSAGLDIIPNEQLKSWIDWVNAA